MFRSLARFACIGIAAFALSLGSLALAGDGAQGFIQGRQAEVTSLLRQGAGAQRDKKVGAVLDQMIDFSVLAQRSLASHWGELSPAQQDEFTGILKQLVQRNYERSIKNILNYKVEYLGEEPAKEDGAVIVHTRATSQVNQREEPISIDYRLLSAKGSWRVIDIVTEGSSLVGNYRSQFHKIIQKDGYDALVRKMKNKLAKGESV